jgi:NADPH:quinone reductase
MRALVTDPSADLGLKLADVPEPQPERGELLVRMEAASVNRGEVRRAKLNPPGLVIGWDLVGTVVGLGEATAGFSLGDRVLALVPAGGSGSFAELVRAPAHWAVPIGSDADAVKLSTLPVAGITALGLLDVAGVTTDDRVLITGGAGGVGLFVIQLAAALGAEVTAQVSTADRGEAARAAGAHHVMLHPGDGSPVEGSFDVVLDSIGGKMLRPLLHATASHGRVALFGNSAGGESSISVDDIYRVPATVYGFFLFVSMPPEKGRAHLADLANRVTAGTLTTTVQAAAPLPDALPLLQDLMDRKVTGKVVLTAT